MRKIFVDRGEEASAIVAKILRESDDEIVLVIPRNSLISGSINNFHFMKKEAEDVGRRLLIESVDDEVLAMAKQSNIEAIHPLLRSRSAPNSLADIRPADPQYDENVEPAPVPIHDRVKKTPKKISKLSLPKFGRGKTQVVLAPEGDPLEAEELEREEDVALAEAKDQPIQYESRPAALMTPEPVRSTSRGRRWLATIIGAIVAVLIIGWLLGVLLGHAAVNVQFNLTNWNQQTTVTADKSVGAVDPSSDTIPGEVFTQEKNFTQSFPASSKQQVSIKATGKILVFNDYSTQPQDLVATTRFLTPDGKLFRLINSITVPAATMQGGKIVPTSIEADVIADQPGPDYNISTSENLSIPGFAGTAKEQGFYGTMEETSGGFIGLASVPTSADISQAKQQVTATLEQNLSNGGLDAPAGLVVLSDASQVTVNQIQVSTTTDANGNFTVFGQATLNAVAFKQDDLKSLLASLANQQNSGGSAPQLSFRNLTLNYSQITPDFTNGTVQFTVSSQGMLGPVFSIGDFTSKILGQKVSEVRTYVATLPDLNGAQISVWPSWLGSLPSNPAKVKVTSN